VSVWSDMIVRNGVKGRFKRAKRTDVGDMTSVLDGYEDTTTSDVDVWIQPADADVSQLYETRRQRVTHVAYVGVDVGVLGADAILDVGSKRYTVHGGPLDMAGRGKMWRVDVQSQENPA